MVELEKVSETVSAWGLGRCILDSKLAEFLVHPSVEVCDQGVCPESVEPFHVIRHLSRAGGLALLKRSGTYIDIVLSELITRDLSERTIQSPVCRRGGLLSSRSLLGPAFNQYMKYWSSRRSVYVRVRSIGASVHTIGLSDLVALGGLRSISIG